MKLSIVGLLVTIIRIVLGLSVTFYAGDQCRGERHGDRKITTADGCQDAAQFNGISTSILITPPADDDGTGIVSFYEGDTCALERPTAAANDGCISIGAGVNNFRSFNVIGETSGPVKTAYLSPRSMDQVQHGDIFEHDDKVWRWQQIAKRTFQGVFAEEWDTQRRIPVNEPLVFNETYPFNFEEYYRAHPEMLHARTSGQSLNIKRQADPNSGLLPFCRRAVECVYGVPYVASIYFPRETECVVNAIEAARQQATPERIWTFLVQPLIIPVPIAILTGVVTWYISSQYFGSSGDVPESCTQAEDTAVLAALIDSGAVGEDAVNAIRASIVNDDIQTRGDVVVALGTDETPNGGRYCGAPPTTGT